MPKATVPTRPKPGRITNRNALLAAALRAGYPTLAALAKELGVHRETFSYIANGHNPVSAAMAAKLRALKLPDESSWLSAP